MSSRISVKDLEGVTARLNRITDSPEAPYTQDENGKFKANVGCYVIDGAYSGYQLQRIMNEGGGVTSITNGYLPKREVYNLIHSYMKGILDATD